MASQLIEFTDRGLYCAQADVFIDPWKPVDKALITHAHGDHARWGHKYYLSHKDSIPVMKIRLGNNNYQGVDFGETTYMNGVEISFHPAGHIIGSAQIRMSYGGEVWVISGDYKLENDGISPAFEPVKAQHFVTESTFGLPIYKWKPQAQIFADINAWWAGNVQKGLTTILLGYSLGKAQRMLAHVDKSIGPIYLHGAIYNINKGLNEAGLPVEVFPKYDATVKKDMLKGALIVAPPSAAGSPWMRKFSPSSLGVASGWMALRGAKKRRAADKGFVLSDHADWEGLNEAVRLSEAQHVYVTHGYTTQFSTWLRTLGIDARTVNTLYASDEDIKASDDELIESGLSKNIEDDEEIEVQDINEELSA